MKPMAIVIHVMAGSLLGTDEWFASHESGVSAHYGVGRSGEVHQYVAEEDQAFHAGTIVRPSWPLLQKTKSEHYINPNLYTIGIEHEGREHDKWTDAQYAASAELIAGIARRWQIPIDEGHVIPHHAIRASKPCPGDGVNLVRLISMAKERV